MDQQRAIKQSWGADEQSAPTQLVPIGAVGWLDTLVGRVLYGEQWITPMARDLKIDPDMVTEWGLGQA